MPAPTLRDVAQLAGVHPATASRALNPQTRPLVNADTARKVFRLIDALEDSDDVQNVYSNFDLSPEVQAELETED